MAPPYPADWNDDDRMSFLFSAFKRTRDVDIGDWDGKMAFWIPLLVEHAKADGLASITLRQLQLHFKRNGCTPLGLEMVMQEMLRRGSLQRETDFVAGVSSGWISWGMRQLVIKPLRWTFGSILGGQMNLDEPFVIPDVLKDLAELVLQTYQSSPQSSFPLLLEDDVCTLCKEVIPDQSAFKLALLQLQRDKKICVLQRPGERLVKFVQSGKNQVTPIGEADLGIYELQKSEELLSERVQKTCEESERLKEEAISFKRNGNKHQALRCMKRWKMSERRLSELQNKLDTIQSILEKISSAETDRTVVSAYQMGFSALRTALKDTSLEKAESLVDQIQEFCDLQDDISTTLAGVGPGDVDVDMDELEKELNDVLQRDVVDLPTVPTGPLISSPQRLSEGQNNGAFVLSQLELDLPDVPTAPFGASPIRPAAMERRHDPPSQTQRVLFH